MEERPKTLPEIRGHSFTPVPRRDRDGQIDDKLYTARSYAALYGIAVEEAEEVVSSCNTHTQADRMITSTLAANPEKLRAVLFQDADADDAELDEYRNASPAELLWKVRQMMGEMANG